MSSNFCTSTKKRSNCKHFAVEIKKVDDIRIRDAFYNESDVGYIFKVNFQYDTISSSFA